MERGYEEEQRAAFYGYSYGSQKTEAQPGYDEDWMMQHQFAQNATTADEEELYPYEYLQDDEETKQGEDETNVESAVGRLADIALKSWGVEDAHVRRKSAVKLNLSLKGGGLSMKELLAQRGGGPLFGLHKAAAEGKGNSIMAIMKHEGPNAPLDELDDNGCTPLMYAAMADSERAIQLLLNLSAAREQVDAVGRTTVHYAAFFGNHKALKLLIETGASWASEDIYGRTPLHWACFPRTTKCVSVLLQHARTVLGEIELYDQEAMTPLMCAAQYARPRHIELLYEAGADITAVDIEEKTALHWTARNPDAACVHVLLSIYPPLLNNRDCNGQTLLHLVALNGNTLIANALLSTLGIEIDARDSEDRTPLHYACLGGFSDIVQLLVSRVAMDSCIDSHGLTALHYAVQNNSVKSIQHLVSSFKHITTTHVPSADNLSLTPLMMAAKEGLTDALTALVMNKMIVENIDQTDPEGKSALHFAVQAGSQDCVSVLLASGANPNLADKKKETPLFTACVHGHHNLIPYLSAGGADLHVVNGDGLLPLHEAVLADYYEVARELILAGSKVDAEAATGNTPLQLSAIKGLKRIAELLLKSGADPNLLDGNGLAALHLACKEGHAHLILLLHSHGAFVNFMDATDEMFTPLDYAERNSHPDCVDILCDLQGVAVGRIMEMAATSIQRTYRGYRARLMLLRLKREYAAAVMIQKHVRGFLCRRRYRETRRQMSAATIIQASVRGFLQRNRYRKQRQLYREQKRKQKMIEDFSCMILHHDGGSLLKTITIPSELAPSEETPSQRTGEELDRKKSELNKKTEQALRMRALLLEQQKRWEEFRAAEKQRRIDKARQEELDRLHGVIADSQARRQHFKKKFRYTTVVRSRHHAAVVIQRAFRMAKIQREEKRRQMELESQRRLRTATRSAVIIQRAWRSHRAWKRYVEANFKSILTSPVVAVSPQQPHGTCNSTALKSYERNTLVLGSRRHKLHQTCISGFMIFKQSGTRAAPLNSVAHKHVESWHRQHSRKTLSRLKRLESHWPWSKYLVSPSPLDEERQLSNGGRSTTEKSVELPVILSSPKGVVQKFPQPSVTRLQLPPIP